MARTLLQLPSEFRQAREEALIKAAQRVFIFSPDLSDYGLGSSPLLDRLASLFAQNPAFELKIILQSDAWIKESAPKLRSLLELRSRQSEIRIAENEARKAQDSFLLTNNAVVKQMVASQPWGVADSDDPEQVRLLLSRWESLWESSAPMAPFRSLGL